jgi:uncharacterized protein YbjT (DUF2867 family)
MPPEPAVPGGSAPSVSDRPFRTLVLGANGNVGSLLVRELAGRGADVVGAIRPRRTPPAEPRGVRWVKVELDAPGTLRAALDGVDGVVWTPSVGLVPSCLPVLEAARPERVVIVSSASVHTRLGSSGARRKRDAEAAIRGSGLRYAILRPTMIYGNARDRNLTRLLDYLERFPFFPLFGEGSGLMQPVFVDDLVEAILRALVSPLARCETYDLGGATALTYRELVESAAAALGRRVRFARVPLGLAAGSLRWANRLGMRFLREEQVHRLTEDKVVDNARIMTDLGLAPRGFAEGIAEQVRARRAVRGATLGP